MKVNKSQHDEVLCEQKFPSFGGVRGGFYEEKMPMNKGLSPEIQNLQIPGKTGGTP
ncbi:MAG: hypothetical protein WCI54_05585 [Bacteroidia bacterium]